jgi:DnaJ-class molecular chaperone
MPREKPDTDGRSEAGQPLIKPGDQAPPGTPGSGENICRRCRGSGRLGDQPCPDCQGTGRVNAELGGA